MSNNKLDDPDSDDYLMVLRDKFAGEALYALLVGPSVDRHVAPSPKLVATLAYEYADYMMRARAGEI